MIRTLTFECSPEQEDVVADHLLNGTELGVQPDERAWIRAKVFKLAGPNARVTGADLDAASATWTVTIQL